MTMQSDESASAKKKAIEGVVGFVISLILSTGLVGGCTYLLFGFREDIQQISSDRAAIAKDIAENAHAIQLIKQWNRPKYQQAQNIVNLFYQISAVKDVPLLDPHFLKQAQGKAQFILVTLINLKGDAEGSHFSTPALARYQQSLIQALEPQIEMVTILRDLLADWKAFTIDKRSTELDRIHQLVIHQVEKQAQHGSVIRDAMFYHQKKMDDDELRHAEIRSKLTTIYIKIALSGVGIFAGIILLSWSLRRIRPALGKHKMDRA